MNGGFPGHRATPSCHPAIRLGFSLIYKQSSDKGIPPVMETTKSINDEP